LPSIETSSGERYIGLDACVQFYESIAGLGDLLQKATAFKAANREYRIRA